MLRRLRKRFRRARARTFRTRLLDAAPPPLVRLGTDYGGWHVPLAALRPGATALCVGAGEDISFDVALNAVYAMRVITLDPTPRARTHVDAVVQAAPHGRVPINADPTHAYDLTGFDPDRFTFLPLALWKEDGPLRFYAPRNPDSVSHSAVNLQKTDHYLEVEAVTLTGLAAQCDLQAIEILKMDVEGAEYEIIAHLADQPLRPNVLCVEFDEGDKPTDAGYLRRIGAAVDALRALGYRLVHMEGWDFLFISSAAMDDYAASAA